MSDRIALTTGEVLDIALWPLPEGVVDDGTPLNRKELSDVFGKSENTISAWVSKGMPVLSGGSNGVAYEFSLSQCWAWRQWRQEEEQAERAKRDRQRSQNALIFRNLDSDWAEEEGGLSSAELRAWSEAEYHRNRAAEQRGDLVRADRMRTVLDEVFVAFGNALDTLPDFAELEFGLDAAQVEIFQRHCDQIRLDVKKRIGQALKKDGAVVGLTDRGGQTELGI